MAKWLLISPLADFPTVTTATVALLDRVVRCVALVVHVERPAVAQHIPHQRHGPDRGRPAAARSPTTARTMLHPGSGQNKSPASARSTSASSRRQVPAVPSVSCRLGLLSAGRADHGHREAHTERLYRVPERFLGPGRPTTGDLRLDIDDAADKARVRPLRSPRRNCSSTPPCATSPCSRPTTILGRAGASITASPTRTSMQFAFIVVVGGTSVATQNAAPSDPPRARCTRPRWPATRRPCGSSFSPA